MEDGSAWNSLGPKDLLNTGIILSICIKIESSYMSHTIRDGFC